MASRAVVLVVGVQAHVPQLRDQDRVSSRLPPAGRLAAATGPTVLAGLVTALVLFVR